MSASKLKVRLVDWCRRANAARIAKAKRGGSGVIAAFVMMVILGAAARPVAAQSIITTPATAPVATEAGVDAAAAVRPLASYRFYWGARKGITWDGREHHHYVEFDTNRCGEVSIWSAPLPSSRWGFVNGSNCRKYRVGYSWPSNWWDPYFAWQWVILVRE